MRGMLAARQIGAILGVAAFLGSISPAQPACAGDPKACALRDSAVPIRVINASSSSSDARRAEVSEDHSVSTNKRIAQDSHNVVERRLEAWALLADVPLGAWFLLVTCLLAARLGPRIVRGFHDEGTGANARRASRQTEARWDKSV